MKTVEIQCAVALRDSGPSTITQLVRSTGLSRPTVDAALAALQHEGLVAVADENVGGGRDAGRPAKLFTFVPDAGLVAGVDVGAHVVRVLLADLSGAIVASDEAAIDPARGGDDAFDTVVGLLDAAISRVGGDPARLRGVGVGVTGMVGSDGRIALSYSLPAWNAVDVAALLEQRYRCAVVLENDARLASMAEHHLGASVLAQNVVYLQAGHRLSISLIVDGRVHRGRHHGSGEASYLLFDGVPSDEAGNIIWSSAPTAEGVVSGSLKGDPAAAAELDEFVAALAPGIAALSLIVDPDVVVIGGGISRSEALIRALQEAVRAHIRVPVVPHLVQSRLGAEAVVVGGVLRAYELAAAPVFGAADVPAPRIAVDAVLLPSMALGPRHQPPSHEPAGADRPA